MAMSFFTSFILGIVQALTEFLPISSSAHLKIVKYILGSESSILLDLSCHLGTLGALVIFLRKEIIHLFFHEQRKIILFFLALIPLIPFYFLLKPLREAASDIHLLGFWLIGTGGILLAGQSFCMARSENEGFIAKIKDVLMIGVMQSTALIPGISRSASTISCARILGWNVKEAVRFSFLLSIPTILGGNLLEFMKVTSETYKEGSIPILQLATSFIVSFFLGLFLVKKAISWLEKGNLKPCAWY
ncbi:MAG: undecaprenyl-diphosphate phosphatase, partial [Verrucomicrobia bacterium]|nr:undecaprenyl-diphosphate phosphatase [Verrucomicrobiota bacterium]